jgi:cellobiose dehydrogenase (acceptor)
MISSLLLVSLSALINAAQAISYTDHSGLPFTGIHDHTVGFTLGFIFPPSLNGTEFIGEIMASNTQRWAGIALGGAMTESPLIMTWPKGKKGKFSTRYATCVDFARAH